MAQQITIRDAKIEDAEIIQSMIAALARATGRPDGDVLSVEEARRHGFSPHPDFRALIAEQKNEQIGLAVYFSEFSTWRGKRGVYIQDIYVQPSVRGFGVGRRLINSVLSRALADGAAYLRLSTDKSNARAARFYRNIGFIEAKYERMFVLEGEPFAGLASDFAWAPRPLTPDGPKPEIS